MPPLPFYFECEQMYSIGQKVVCIDGRWGQATGTTLQIVTCPNLPVVGRVYTVRWVEQLIAVFSEGPCWFVRLVEAPNPVNHNGHEPIFRANQFVPVLERGDLTFAYDILKNPNRSLVRENRHERKVFRKRKVGV